MKFKSIAVAVSCTMLFSDGAFAQSADERPTGFPAACAPREVEVMILGVYHFANPGRDVIKQDFDDVLTPERQLELEHLSSRLVEWRPDRIAVEASWSTFDSTQARYARYRAGALAPASRVRFPGPANIARRGRLR